jgi:hypothetical protein
MANSTYPLLGMFDVNMRFICGESTKAFRRLQQNIVMCYNGLTIFACKTGTDVRQELVISLVILSEKFVGSHDVNQFTADLVNFSITNEGLQWSKQESFVTISLNHLSRNRYRTSKALSKSRPCVSLFKSAIPRGYTIY